VTNHEVEGVQVKNNVLSRAHDGRHREVASAYKLHATTLRKIVRAKILSGASREAGAGHAEAAALPMQDVDDLVHEVFTRLLVPPVVQLAEDRNPLPYLVAMARNFHHDFLRRRRRQAVKLCLAFDQGLNRLPVPSSHDPLEDDVDGQRRRQLEVIAAHVASLPTELSVLYEARFARGLSQVDSATLLGVSRRHVRTLEARLLASAKQSLAGAASVVAGPAARRVR
jgi:RNA polymerase sigma factor (sigma-70 family)